MKRVALAAGVVASLALAGPAAARPVALTVTPKRPMTNETLLVHFTAGRLKAEDRYVVGFRATGTSSTCLTGYRIQLRRQRPGARVSVVLGPNAGQQTVLTSLPVLAGKFCVMRNDVVVGRITPDGVYTRIAKLPITFGPGPGDGRPLVTPVGMSGGGTLSITAPGRPDRSIPVSASFRGTVPGKLNLQGDTQATLTSGGLQLSEIVPDPLCAGDRYQPELPLTTAQPATLVMLGNGAATMTLPLAADPLALAGCALPSAPGLTTMTLTGRREPMSPLTLSGSVSGVPIGPGVTGTVTLALTSGFAATGDTGVAG